MVSLLRLDRFEVLGMSTVSKLGNSFWANPFE
jgi:hypothetical protein